MWLVVPMFLAASQWERSFLRPQGMTLGKLVFDPQAQTIHQAHAAAIKQRGQPPTPATRLSVTGLRIASAKLDAGFKSSMRWHSVGVCCVFAGDDGASGLNRCRAMI
jgi:hypothetical protein